MANRFSTSKWYKEMVNINKLNLLLQTSAECHTYSLNRGRNSKMSSAEDSSLHTAETQQIKCRDLEVRPLEHWSR